MHLSPDEIQRRTFAIEDRGYDRDQVRDFLLEVASALRMALHTTRPPTTAAAAAATAADPRTGDTVTSGGADEFARLGTEVAEVLRAAHEAVAALQEQADRDIEGRLLDAEARSEDIRRQAEADATWNQDRARRVLITAQEQADGIIAEAERAAAELIDVARRQAKDQADQVATRTRRHAEQILRAEREALRRLHEAQAGVAAAVEMLTGSEIRPVVDLTELRPSVRLGELDVETNEDDDRGGEARPDRSSDDPVVRMVRSAVDRAAEHARLVGPGDELDDVDDVADVHGTDEVGGPDDGPAGRPRRSDPPLEGDDRRSGDAPDPDPRPEPARRQPPPAAGRVRFAGPPSVPDEAEPTGEVPPVASVRRTSAAPPSSALRASADPDPGRRASH